ncbi:MAG: ferredoxin [Candidatus Buchananbacteria bacterium]|nr:ferredoxin [Candidatus Buchananbacteria bacterium]
MVDLLDKKKPSGPIKLKNGWTVEVDRQACIGAATCVAIAPDSYDLDDEAKAVIIDGIQTDTDQRILDGAKSCPVDAIIIKDQDGKRIYPK